MIDGGGEPGRVPEAGLTQSASKPPSARSSAKSKVSGEPAVEPIAEEPTAEKPAAEELAVNVN